MINSFDFHIPTKSVEHVYRQVSQFWQRKPRVKLTFSIFPYRFPAWFAVFAKNLLVVFPSSCAALAVQINSVSEMGASFGPGLVAVFMFMFMLSYSLASRCFDSVLIHFSRRHSVTVIAVVPRSFLPWSMPLLRRHRHHRRRRLFLLLLRKTPPRIID